MSGINGEYVISQLHQFDFFTSTLQTQVSDFLEIIKTPISFLTPTKLQMQIRYLLFRFLTGSPFSLWKDLYSPLRVSHVPIIPFLNVNEFADYLNYSNILSWLRNKMDNSSNSGSENITKESKTSRNVILSSDMSTVMMTSLSILIIIQKIQIWVKNIIVYSTPMFADNGKIKPTSSNSMDHQDQERLLHYVVHSNLSTYKYSFLLFPKTNSGRFYTYQDFQTLEI